jgi:hypothetical protein
MSQNSINSTNQVLQFLSTQVGTLIDCSTPVIPADNTIPQNTEGTQVLTLSITPKLATSNLRIIFSGMFSKGAATGQTTVALFQDSNANALAAKCWDQTVASSCTGIIDYTMTSGTTSSTTFKIRAGPAANTLYCNGADGGVQWLGGVGATILTIEEYT